MVNPSKDIEAPQYQAFFKLLEDGIDPKETSFYLNGQEVRLIPGKKPRKSALSTAIIDPDNLPIAVGGAKKAYSFGDVVCLLPNTDSDPIDVAQWNRMISEEKKASEELASRGFKTQDFTIDTLSVKDKTTNDIYTIKVLSAKNFHSMAKDEQTTIIDRKANIHFGEKISFYNGKSDNLNDQKWNTLLLQSLMDELVYAFTYRAPCNLDSMSYYVAHARSSETPPSCHLIFYDFTDKKIALKMPLLSHSPCDISKEQVLSEFQNALSYLFSIASDDELDALGLQKVRNLWQDNGLSKQQKPYLDQNIALMTELFETAKKKVSEGWDPSVGMKKKLNLSS